MARLKNNMGLTAYDILRRSPKDFKALEIQVMLMENSGNRNENNGIFPTHSHPPSPQVVRPRVRKKKMTNCLIWILKWIGGWFRDKGDWIEEMRGNLSLVSTVIATITFQALVNPPGGFIQQGLAQGSSNDALNCTTLSNNESYCPGEAVSSFVTEIWFLRYIICNTICFISSLGVTLLLVSGVPMKNKALIWLLSIGMCVTLTALAFAYLTALVMVTPSHMLYDDNSVILITIGTSVLAWGGLLVLIIVLITLRLIFWAVKKCIRAIKKLFTCGIRES